MEQDTNVKRKAKIVIIILSVLIAIRLIDLVLAGSLISLVSLVIPIVMLYWMNKKTIKGYQTARIWVAVFFGVLLVGNGVNLPENSDTFGIISYVVVVGIMVIVALLINSICKSFEPKVEDTRSLRNKKVWKIIAYVFLGLFIVPVIMAIISYFNGTLTF